MQTEEMTSRGEEVFDADVLERAASCCRRARNQVALTGAGISVGCGIPDFRSPGGLWSRYDPMQVASLEAFLRSPERAWEFYRELGEALGGKRPGRAHQALSVLEERGSLRGVITQNIDGLHHLAGSRRVLEVHGDWRHLHCLRCGTRETNLGNGSASGVPACPRCRGPLKPDVVLFGEPVRLVDAVDRLLADCDFLLLIGTSGDVFPVADWPRRVRRQGGTLCEFNLRETSLSRLCSFRILGSVEETVPRFVASLLRPEGLSAEPSPGPPRPIG